MKTNWTPGERRVKRFEEAQTVVLSNNALIGNFTGECRDADAALDAPAPKLAEALEPAYQRLRQLQHEWHCGVLEGGTICRCGLTALIEKAVDALRAAGVEV